jgi:hypothetical protein
VRTAYCVLRHFERNAAFSPEHHRMGPIQDKFFFALSNSYYLNYDGLPGAAYKIIEKNVTFGINVGT